MKAEQGESEKSLDEPEEARVEKRKKKLKENDYSDSYPLWVY
ncbi:MAG: hypothetical protein ACFFD6_11355 [Candidatus Thorarchaeota archaeon]